MVRSSESCDRAVVVSENTAIDWSRADTMWRFVRGAPCPRQGFPMKQHNKGIDGLIGWLVGWLYLTSHRQRGHLETSPPFTVPCEGREARSIHRSHRELNPGPSRGSPLHYRCATPASESLGLLLQDDSVILKVTSIPDTHTYLLELLNEYRRWHINRMDQSISKSDAQKIILCNTTVTLRIYRLLIILKFGSLP